VRVEVAEVEDVGTTGVGAERRSAGLDLSGGGKGEEEE
jgi:hypothetical protein